jgi:hypothetical protein
MFTVTTGLYSVCRTVVRNNGKIDIQRDSSQQQKDTNKVQKPIINLYNTTYNREQTFPSLNILRRGFMF